MRWKLVYFDDQIENIECFRLQLEERFDVVGCVDVLNYQQVLREHNPHAYLLDVHMPKMNGHELYLKITSDSSYNGCPIIFISGDLSIENQLSSHNSGGLDFFTRELSSDEMEVRLVSKIKFFLATTNQLKMGNLTLNFETLQVFINEIPVELTLLEMRIISYLFRKLPESVTRDDLYKTIWGNSSEVKPGTINTHITNFMSKLQGWSHTIQIRQDNILIVDKT